MGTNRKMKIGDTFGALEVVDLVSDRPKNPTRYVKCRCNLCGNVGNYQKACLWRGGSTKCVECAAVARRKVVPGERYGDYTVIRIENIPRRNSMWLCQCDCGEFSHVTADVLRSHEHPCCRKCAFRKLRKGNIDPTIWCVIRHSAESRGLPLEVDMEFVKALIEKQDYKCALSGLPIHYATSCEELASGMHTASLDRIDSKKGYTRDNVQWCHRDINLIKVDYPEEEFIMLCCAVADHQRSLQAQDQLAASMHCAPPTRHVHQPSGTGFQALQQIIAQQECSGCDPYGSGFTALKNLSS